MANSIPRITGNDWFSVFGFISTDQKNVMQIEIKLFTQLKQYLPDTDLAGSSRFLDIAEPATVQDVLQKLGIPLEMPKVIMINERQGAMDDDLAANDRLTIFPSVGGG